MWEETAAAQALFAATELFALTAELGAEMAHKVALTAPAQASTIFKYKICRDGHAFFVNLKSKH
jgi:hypothetical protein